MKNKEYEKVKRKNKASKRKKIKYWRKEINENEWKRERRKDRKKCEEIIENKYRMNELRN